VESFINLVFKKQYMLGFVIFIYSNFYRRFGYLFQQMKILIAVWSYIPTEIFGINMAIFDSNRKIQLLLNKFPSFYNYAINISDNLVKYMIKDNLIENMIFCVVQLLVPFLLISSFDVNYIHYFWTLTLANMGFSKFLIYSSYFDN